MLRSIGFSLEPLEGESPGRLVTPVVDGVALTELIHAFELAAGMESKGTTRYGGHDVGYGFGPALAFYFGRAAGFTRPGWVPLLGCECGDMACYPLWAEVEADDETVRWVNFEQPYHPERDYSGFGPFAFDRAEYESAIAALGDIWPTRVTAG